jgi:hypothetical protein
MMTKIEGGCLCGGVRYQLHEPPRSMSNCYCLDCRRASAAPFVTWGEVKRASVELRAGELREIRHAGRLRSFAACCGTPLFFADHAATESIDVTIASLDRPEGFRPEVAIWTEDRLPWVPLDPADSSHRQDRNSRPNE